MYGITRFVCNTLGKPLLGLSINVLRHDGDGVIDAKWYRDSDGQTVGSLTHVYQTPRIILFVSEPGFYDIEYYLENGLLSVEERIHVGPVLIPQ